MIRKGLLLLPLLVVPVFAQKPCDDLKTEISTKLDKAGVKNYQVEAVKTSEVGDQKVIGSCESGTKKIVYRRSAPITAAQAGPIRHPPQTPPPPSKPDHGGKPPQNPPHPPPGAPGPHSPLPPNHPGPSHNRDKDKDKKK